MAGDPKSRILIVDWLFRWPPDGGARVELLRLLEFLAPRCELRLLCPRVEGDPFGRGLLGGLPDALRPIVKPLSFSREAFLRGDALQAFLLEAEAFAPDKVLIGDAWHFKPILAAAFAKWKPVLRFFAHEGLCLKGHGHRYRDEAPCDYCYLDSGSSFERCRVCGSSWKARAKTGVFDLEWEAAGLPDSKDYADAMRRALSSASAAIVYNAREAARLKPFCRSCYVSGGGVEDSWLEKPREGSFPKRPGLWRVLLPGRCDDYLKGLGVLVAAGELLSKAGRRDFEIAYTGAPKPQWADFRWLKPLGWLSRPELEMELLDSDLTVHPSLWPEPFGIAALESLAKGVPILVSAHGGLLDTVEASGGGMPFAPGDPRALAEFLSNVFDHPLWAQAMGRDGRAFASKRTWRDVFNESYVPALDLPKEASL